MKTTLAFLILASVVSAADYDSVHLKAEMTMSVPGLPPATCIIEFKGAGEPYLYDVECAGEGAVSEVVAYDGDRTRSWQKVTHTVDSAPGKQESELRAFNPLLIFPPGDVRVGERLVRTQGETKTAWRILELSHPTFTPEDFTIAPPGTTEKRSEEYANPSP